MPPLTISVFLCVALISTPSSRIRACNHKQSVDPYVMHTQLVNSLRTYAFLDHQLVVIVLDDPEAVVALDVLVEALAAGGVLGGQRVLQPEGDVAERAAEVCNNKQSLKISPLITSNGALPVCLRLPAGTVMAPTSSWVRGGAMHHASCVFAVPLTEGTALATAARHAASEKASFIISCENVLQSELLSHSRGRRRVGDAWSGRCPGCGSTAWMWTTHGSLAQ